MAEATHLIIGCGYLGQRVAACWLGRGNHVSALTRARANQLQRAGITPIPGDILEPATLRALPKASTVLYAIGQDRSSGRSFHDVHVAGLMNVLDNVPAPDRFIYISSISVYSQTGGEEVDESSPAEPLEENGRVIRLAETRLQERLPGAMVLRFAGIYGPGRVIRRAAVESGQSLGDDPEKWLNLIHVDDGARAVLAAEERGLPGEIYLIADGHPVKRREFYTGMAELLSAPPVRFDCLGTDAASPLHHRPNRRINNHKMRAQLGVELRYPDYRAGLRASI